MEELPTSASDIQVREPGAGTKKDEVDVVDKEVENYLQVLQIFK